MFFNCTKCKLNANFKAYILFMVVANFTNIDIIRGVFNKKVGVKAIQQKLFA